MIPVVISGGSGQRLWPVSRASYPKQFCDFLENSFLESTIQRLDSLGKVIVLTVESMKILTEKTALPLGLQTKDFIYEPFGRNTAPAIALLCHILQCRNQEAEIVGIFPADHFILNKAEFLRTVQLGISEAENNQIVTLGIKPHYPATGYGYIEVDLDNEEQIQKNLKACKVKQFCEKPKLELAKEFVNSGKHFWNAGMFLFKVSTMIELFKEFQPDMWQQIQKVKPDLSNSAEVYESLENISIDYAIMENASNQMCIPCDINWSDVGSWEELSRIMHEQSGKDHNSLTNFYEVSGNNNFAFSNETKNIVFAGTDDLIVVNTADAILVAQKGKSEEIKKALKSMSEEGNEAADQHIFDHRPWGKYEILRDTESFKSKVITVNPDQQLSYQSHKRRAEHWIVVEGVAEVTLNDKIHKLTSGESIFIPKEAKHRVKNPGKQNLVFVEVQTGEYFGEDDIIRYEDNYGRA